MNFLSGSQLACLWFCGLKFRLCGEKCTRKYQEETPNPPVMNVFKAGFLTGCGTNPKPLGWTAHRVVWLYLPGAPNRRALTLHLFYLKSRDHKGASATPEVKKTMEPQWALKTSRLRDYTVQSHSSMTPNHTYASCERLAHVAEDMIQMETGLVGVAEAHHSLQGDLESLLSVYKEKGTWYKEEGEAARKRLSQVRYEFRKVEATRKMLQEEIGTVDNCLENVSGKYRQRQDLLRSLRQQLLAQLQWMQEAIGSLQEEEAGSHTHLSQEVGRALKELLSMASVRFPMPNALKSQTGPGEEAVCGQPGKLPKAVRTPPMEAVIQDCVSMQPLDPHDEEGSSQAA